MKRERNPAPVEIFMQYINYTDIPDEEIPGQESSIYETGKRILFYILEKLKVLIMDITVINLVWNQNNLTMLLVGTFILVCLLFVCYFSCCHFRSKSNDKKGVGSSLISDELSNNNEY